MISPTRTDSTRPTVLRCVHASCARSLPRRVNYCPYCGTPQHESYARPATATMPAPAPAATAAPPSAPPKRPVTAAPAVKADPRPPPVAAPRGKPKRNWHLRGMLTALALIATIWLLAGPRPNRDSEAKVRDAIALTGQCRFDEARQALQDLRTAGATPRQLDRLQQAIDTALVSCAPPPKPKPVVKPQKDHQSVRNLLASARAQIAVADYQGAIDKMEVCAAMIDPDNKACRDVRRQAETLQTQMRSCVDGGREWIKGRCE